MILRKLTLGLGWLSMACLLMITTINCGDPVCDPACTGGRACVQGQCVIVCPEGQTECDSKCVDTQTNAANCGACGTACPTGQACSAGACAVSCPDGQENCDGKCYDLQTSVGNCGACGTACAAGQVCSTGSCSTSCGGSLTDCSGSCVNTMVDNANCGACGTACAAGQVCTNGTCEVTCADGQTKCGDVCVDTMSNRANCGACGTACASNEVCNMGSCATSCAMGLTDCSGACVNTMTDLANCGACGTACATGQICNNGTCETSCPDGQTNCSDVCIDTMADDANCGMCGTTCAANEKCESGTCTLQCPTGQTNCNGTCVDTNNDRNNCGMCGTVCMGMDEVCAVGMCQQSCPVPGQVRCGGTCTSLASDAANCGTCGTACQMGEVCVRGGCITSCTVSNVQRRFNANAPSSIYGLAVSPNGGVVYGSSSGDDLMAWNTVTGQLIYQVSLPEWGYELAISPNGQLLAVAGYTNDVVYIHRASDGALLSTLQGHTNTVYAVAFSPDSTQVASAGSSGELILWKVSDGSIVHNFTDMAVTNTFYGVNFSPNGALLAASGSSGYIAFYDIAMKMQLRRATPLSSVGTVYDVEFSPDGTQVATGASSGDVRIFTVATGAEVVQVNTGFTGTVYDVDWSPSGNKLAVASSSSSDYVTIWDVATGTKDQSFSAHTSTTYAVEWSTDGLTLYSSSGDQSVLAYGCCAAGQTYCSTACADLAADTANCGSCGNACPMGNVCANGSCQAACPAGFTDCNGRCVNTQTDNANCGMCGTVCDGVCSAGACQRVCKVGETVCNGRCSDLQTDAQNCSMCGMACPAGQKCLAGACGCDPGQTYCMMQQACADLQNDAQNCGTCGTTCPVGQKCLGGQCGCDPGLSYCMAQQKCVDLRGDTANCGTCGNACAMGQLCGGGQCKTCTDCPAIFSSPASGNYGYGEAVATDAMGNTYYAGRFYTSMTFGMTTLTSNGSADVFVVKADPMGNVLWATSFGSASTDYAYGLTVDSAGAVYVVGRYGSSTNTMTVGMTTLTPVGGSDMFVVKLDAMGAPAWAATGGSSSTDYAYDVAVDGTGNVHVVGYTRSTGTFGTLTTTAAGSSDVFYGRLNNMGVWTIAKVFGGTSVDEGRAIALDSMGNIYIGGRSSSSSITFDMQTASSLDGIDIFVAKLNSAGVTQSLFTGGGSSSQYLYDLAVDSAGAIYITGYFISGGATFGMTSLTSKGSNDMYVAKINAAVNAFDWAVGFGSTSADYGYGIGVNSTGDIYVAGYSGTDNFEAPPYKFDLQGSNEGILLKLNSMGQVTGVASGTGTSSDYFRGLALDSSGNVHIVGETSSASIRFSAQQYLRTTSSTPMPFAVRYDAMTSLCPLTFNDCSGQCTNLEDNVANCGTCGTTCPTGQSCTAGVCGCGIGETYCMTQQACANLNTDPNNCGTCGTVCPAGMAFCDGGTCTNAPVDLFFKEINVGAPDYIIVQNYTAATVNLPDYEVRMWDGIGTSLTNPDTNATLPTGTLAAGAAVTIVERFSTPATGELELSDSIIYTTSSNFIALLCKGPCTTTANIVDLFYTDDTPPSANLTPPMGTSFSPGPLGNLTSDRTQSYIRSTTLTGFAPTWNAADWSVGPKTRP